MAAFLIYKKFTAIEALRTLRDLEEWFEQHPDRADSVTDLAFVVHRGSIVRDILRRTKPEEGGIEET